MSFSKFNLKTIPDLKKIVANYFTDQQHISKKTLFLTYFRSYSFFHFEIFKDVLKTCSITARYASKSRKFRGK